MQNDRYQTRRLLRQQEMWNWDSDLQLATHRLGVKVSIVVQLSADGERCGYSVTITYAPQPKHLLMLIPEMIPEVIQSVAAWFVDGTQLFQAILVHSAEHNKFCALTSDSFQRTDALLSATQLEPNTHP